MNQVRFVFFPPLLYGNLISCYVNPFFVFFYILIRLYLNYLSGYQNYRGTPRGDSENSKYNAVQRYKTVELGMILPLKKISIYPTFNDVIKNHFKLKSSVITNMIRNIWCPLNAEQAGQYKKLTNQLTLLEKQLLLLSKNN